MLKAWKYAYGRVYFQINSPRLFSDLLWKLSLYQAAFELNVEWLFKFISIKFISIKLQKKYKIF